VTTIPRHPLVGRLATALGNPPVVGDFDDAPDVPELVTLVGYISGKIKNPASDNYWLLVYHDWRMTGWWLVEGTGIVHVDTVPEDGNPAWARDVLWVNRDTAVGRGSGPQSDEARFLTGQFVRAGDFDRWETGGPSSAETGLFCPNTPLCNCSAARSR
jgi:hypothetical protein